MPAVHGASPAAPGTLGRRMPPGATSTTTPALRYWRTRRAWVQRELAQHAGVSLISVQRAESGDPLRLTTIRRLAQALGVEPAALGLLTSAYFIAFAAFQIPLGVLLDRYGPRRVESALLIVAAAGALVFARGDSTFALALGRSLIGLGVSSCLMAAIKANTLWWPAGRLPLANGFILACGGLGAIAATAPVEAALAFTDWRDVFVLLALATLAMAALVFVAVPDPPTRPSGDGWGAALAEAGGKVPAEAHAGVMAGLVGLEAAALLWLLAGRRKLSGTGSGTTPERPLRR